MKDEVTAVGIPFILHPSAFILSPLLSPRVARKIRGKPRPRAPKSSAFRQT